MIISFADENEMISLPVAPPDFKIAKGIGIETVSLSEIGDYIFAGKKTLESMTISSFFPKKDYYFATKKKEPYEYIAWIEKRMYDETVVRYIIEGTNINIPVLFTNIVYGERDGTGDVYYDLSLREYKYTGAVITTAAEVESMSQRNDELLYNQTDIETYVIKKGDTLSKICLDKYGNYKLWEKLQKYNGLSTTLIFTGNTLKIPPIKILEEL